MYSGDWNKGKKHGNGEFSYPDGSKYKGTNKTHVISCLLASSSSCVIELITSTSVAGLVTTRECGVVMRSVASVCLCVCLYFRLIRALTFERLDLETSFFICGYNFGISRSSNTYQVRRVRAKVTQEKRDVCERN